MSSVKRLGPQEVCPMCGHAHCTSGICKILHPCQHAKESHNKGRLLTKCGCSYSMTLDERTNYFGTKYPQWTDDILNRFCQELILEDIRFAEEQTEAAEPRDEPLNNFIADYLTTDASETLDASDFARFWSEQIDI